MELVCGKDAATGVTAKQTPVIAITRITNEQTISQLFSLNILPSHGTFAIQTAGPTGPPVKFVFE
jgi:hypothetical protein